ncbi:RagB/SusD family nutrient uptake outer membrane protein [Mucilaginibacter limnophilus]|uniref:RagB/SusD family nutrient uptake outer membrane protein n=1 Tax=Mucilaginibacter limnophilus TaxID=1932778 RepID=A0A3S3TEH8_9SPHI|nr:RagB/SusD family nutrient uptake outer membrane protein [Mucilaginibacter limnophilus]RVT97320.1 RagB/SusD family nutrient uptake outer membrane protein [Mucilaginibacter limnophilus]
MKKSLYFVIAALLASGGCSKSFLDQENSSKRQVENFYKTPDHIYSALMDNYSALQNDGLTNARWVFGDIGSDDALKGGESVGDAPEFEQILENRPQSTNGTVRDLWVGSYTGIAKANIILSKIDGVPFPTDEAGQKLKNQYRAEAQFLRAFNYWYIAMAFGDAPLLTNSVIDFADINPKNLVRKPVADIWKQVETDLNEAIPNLPTRSELASGKQLGRASKGAGQALLAKALMFQRKYDEAVPVLKALVEDNGEYSLVNDYGKLFRLEGEFSTENIFEINFINQASGWGDDCEGSPRVVFQMSRGDWGFGFNQPTQDLVNEFEPGDPRIIYTINWPKDEFKAGVPQKNDQFNPYGYSNRKIYTIESERTSDVFCSGKNETIFRLADMYLLYAEALTQSSAANFTKALFYVNEVRKRANQTPKVDPQRAVQFHTVENVELPMRTFTTKDQLLKDIWHERRVELAMEEIRWWDLVRQGRTNLLKEYYQKWSVAGGFEAKGDLKGKFYTQWIGQLGKTDYLVFPVPQSEIDASQGNLTQTSGY